MTRSAHPRVVAHRGASAALPEHTIGAYELALKEGADGVECDVRLTRDGHLVCVHDRTIDRTLRIREYVEGARTCKLYDFEAGQWLPYSAAG